MNIYQLRKDLAISTNKGIPLFIAGIIFWLIAGISYFYLPIKTVYFVYLFGIGMLFPLGILISKLLRIDLFAKNNPLSSLAGMVGGVQIFFMPLLIIIYLYEPSWIPFVVGTLTGAHFLPYVWLYESLTYLFQTTATVTVSLVCFAFYNESMFYMIPFAMTTVYLISLLGLHNECKNIKKL